MPRMRLRLVLPCLAMLSLTACGWVATSDLPPSRIVDPCDAIAMPPRLDEGRRARLADEIAAAPANAVWPDMLRDAAGIERAVRACQTAR